MTILVDGFLYKEYNTLMTGREYESGAITSIQNSVGQTIQKCSDVRTVVLAANLGQWTIAPSLMCYKPLALPQASVFFQRPNRCETHHRGCAGIGRFAPTGTEAGIALVVKDVIVRAVEDEHLVRSFRGAGAQARAGIAGVETAAAEGHGDAIGVAEEVLAAHHSDGGARL